MAIARLIPHHILATKCHNNERPNVKVEVLAQAVDF